jgi:hypothetical protein
MSYPKQWERAHKAIMDAKAKGLSVPEIVKSVGLTRQTVVKHLTRQAELEEIEARVTGEGFRYRLFGGAKRTVGKTDGNVNDGRY